MTPTDRLTLHESAALSGLSYSEVYRRASGGLCPASQDAAGAWTIALWSVVTDGPVDVRSATDDGRQVWILTSPPPTASGIALGQLVADELSRVLDSSSLRQTMATIDRQELVTTATAAILARLAAAGIR